MNEIENFEKQIGSTDDITRSMTNIGVKDVGEVEIGFKTQTSFQQLQRFITTYNAYLKQHNFKITSQDTGIKRAQERQVTNKTTSDKIQCQVDVRSNQEYRIVYVQKQVANTTIHHFVAIYKKSIKEQLDLAAKHLTRAFDLFERRSQDSKDQAGGRSPNMNSLGIQVRDKIIDAGLSLRDTDRNSSFQYNYWFEGKQARNKFNEIVGLMKQPFGDSKFRVVKERYPGDGERKVHSYTVAIRKHRIDIDVIYNKDKKDSDYDTVSVLYTEMVNGRKIAPAQKVNVEETIDADLDDVNEKMMKNIESFLKTKGFKSKSSRDPSETGKYSIYLSYIKNEKNKAKSLKTQIVDFLSQMEFICDKTQSKNMEDTIRVVYTDSYGLNVRIFTHTKNNDRIIVNLVLKSKN